MLNGREWQKCLMADGQRQASDWDLRERCRRQKVATAGETAGQGAGVVAESAGRSKRILPAGDGSALPNPGTLAKRAASQAVIRLIQMRAARPGTQDGLCQQPANGADQLSAGAGGAASSAASAGAASGAGAAASGAG
jgi:hypothetical protein